MELQCKKCGIIYNNYYINPICKCGHQIRSLTKHEKSMFEKIIDKNEWIHFSTEEKREVFFNIEFYPDGIRNKFIYLSCLVIIWFFLNTSISWKYFDGAIKYILFISSATTLSIILIEINANLRRYMYYRRLKKQNIKF